MKDRKKFAIKKFATQIAISFFFASFFIVIYVVFFNNKVNYYTNLINTIAVNINVDAEEKEIGYNKMAKRLTNYPTYGKKYATLKISSLNMELPIYYGDSMKILRNGVGQYAGSYFPGEGGTTILAAHNSSDFFQRLVDINIGDIIVIEASYGTFKYKVDHTKVVHMSQVEEFTIKDDEEGLLLYTCYPVTRNIVGRRTQRFLVFANRIGDDHE